MVPIRNILCQHMWPYALPEPLSQKLDHGPLHYATYNNGLNHTHYLINH